MIYLFIEALNQYEEAVREHETALRQRGTRHLVPETNNAAERLDRRKRALVDYVDSLHGRVIELTNLCANPSPIFISKEQSK